VIVVNPLPEGEGAGGGDIPKNIIKLLKMRKYNVNSTNKCNNYWICWKYPDIQENINWRYNFWEFNDNVINLVYNTGDCFDRFINECLFLISKMQEKLEKQGYILYFAKIHLPNSQNA